MNWEIIVGISSVVIALCALIFSFWQGVQSRRHNRISFRPHLTSWTHDRHTQGFYAVELLNNGLGPALINRFTIKVDDKIISGEGTEPIKKALQILFPNDQYPYDAKHSYLGSRYSMGAKDRCVVVVLQFKGEKLPSPEFVKHAIDRADLEVNYESFYGEKFFFNSADEKPKI
ncbi:hypothetical protein [uncultured Desulfosarcina sp.]|uniref:hypothetical protein n=1 Tax=uncultured Desulfosarcina sp. TaxID=218289 RepID=UPI0029C86F9B|nr:hypothetical protein [uncultured Desulfosarcina sp.]